MTNMLPKPNANGKYDVFVYGTLKGMHERHPTTKFLGKAFTTGKYTLWDGGFPSATEDGEKFPDFLGHIKGELHEVTAEELIHLDRYEGHPEHFERKIIKVKLDDGSDELDAWMYHGPKDSYVHRAKLCEVSNGYVEWH